ncbi:hypothetical protein OPV22_021626 [Ensete ventricosum]|uniref:Uncharacterized protein n=1 Tax=Ensete ventricosum TaxID=4639 RepID=A0AAV8QMG0_ENSVE|nr:hypothetical protein OPV22_021626 [Ensete ventricosum]
MHHALLVRGSPDVGFRARTHARTPCIARTIDLLLCTLSESEFLRFDPSSVAVSALKTISGSEASFFFSVLPFLIPLPHTGEVNGCQKMMDELSNRTHSVVYLRTAQCAPHVAEAEAEAEVGREAEIQHNNAFFPIPSIQMYSIP